jgi:hypothetical protein
LTIHPSGNGFGGAKAATAFTRLSNSDCSSTTIVSFSIAAE